MKFLKGMGLVFLAALTVLEGQESLAFERRPGWDVAYEVFSLPLSEAAKLKRAGNSDQEDYAELVRRVEAGMAGQEVFLMTRVTEGNTTTQEEVSEVMYATSYDPPEMPNKIGILSDEVENAKYLVTPAGPTAFDTRKVGTTLAVGVLVKEDGAVEVVSNLTLVGYPGRQAWGQGAGLIEMPRFAVQHLKSRLKVKKDSATFMGTMSPPGALPPKEGGRQVWLAFVTVTASKE